MAAALRRAEALADAIEVRLGSSVFKAGISGALAKGRKRPAPRGTGAPQVDRAHGCMALGPRFGFGDGWDDRGASQADSRYDGTAYHGFPDQGAALPTIQRALEAAWTRLVGEEIKMIGAGRTDAGCMQRVRW